MKKTLISIFVMALLLVSALPVFAETGTIELTGGALSVVAQPITFAPITIDGLAHADLPSTNNVEWLVTDPTGSGAGWHVMIAATPFISAANTIAVAGFEMMMSAPVKKDLSNPTGMPTVTGDLASTFTPLVGNQTILTTAVNTGMGQFGFTPTFQLSFPANTYAGTYVSTVTVTIITAP